MKTPLTSRHSYAVELDGEQRQQVVNELMERKKARGQIREVTEPEIRRYLQREVNKALANKGG